MERKPIMWSLSNFTKSNKFPICFHSEQPLNVRWHVGAGDLPSNSGVWPFLLGPLVCIQPRPHRMTARWQASSDPSLRLLVVQSFTPPREFNENHASLSEVMNGLSQVYEIHKARDKRVSGDVSDSVSKLLLMICLIKMKRSHPDLRRKCPGNT